MGDQETWRGPRTLSRSASQVQGVDVARGPGRYAVIAWTKAAVGDAPASSLATRRKGRARVFAAVRRAGEGKFGKSRPISPRRALAGTVDAAADGETVAAWVKRSGSMQVVYRSPNEPWHGQETVAQSGGSPPVLAVGDDGSAAIAWISDAGAEKKVRAAVRAPGGDFGPAQTIVSGSSIGLFVNVAIAGGEAAVGWSGRCGLSAANAQPAKVSVRVAGIFQAPEQIPNSECPNRGLDLAMGPGGEITVLVDGRLDSLNVRAAERPPGGPFGAATTIATHAGNVSLGVDPAGRVVAIWRRYQASGRPMGIAFADHPPGGAFSDATRISGLKAGVAPTLAVGAGGHIAVAWESLGSFKIKAAHADPGGVPRHASPVSRRLTRSAAAMASVALNASGDAIVAWTKPGLPGRGIFFAEFHHG